MNGDVYDVAGTTSALTINAGSGSDTVNVGDFANTLDGLSGALAINGHGKTILTINDQGTTTDKIYNLTANLFTRAASASPRWSRNRSPIRA